jgi:hypothetical protein
LGYITDEDTVDVIDTYKIQREKKRKCAESVKARCPDLQNLTCIGMDSRRDSKALIMKTVGEGDDEKIFRTTGTVENLSFTVESGKLKFYFNGHGR